MNWNEPGSGSAGRAIPASAAARFDHERADSVNRATGWRRIAAIALVSLLLLAVLIALWSALGYLLSAFGP